MFDATVKQRFEECVALANAPRASRLLRSPYRVGYSVLAGALTKRLNFTVRRRSKTHAPPAKPNQRHRTNLEKQIRDRARVTPDPQAHDQGRSPGPLKGTASAGGRSPSRGTAKPSTACFGLSPTGRGVSRSTAIRRCPMLREPVDFGPGQRPGATIQNRQVFTSAR